MNNVLEELRRADSRIFDRLADGEICPADQRTLLAALDDEPGAWRRTALAFIEAQTLRRELGDWQAAAPPAKELARPTGILRPALRRQLALAAVVCLAFFAGLLCAWSRPPFDRHDAGGRLAQHDQQQANQAAKDLPPSVDAPTPDDSLPTDNGENTTDGTVSDGTLRLTFAGATPDDDQNIELPLVFATHIDPQWFDAQWPDGQESAVPVEVLDAWRKAGHVVTQRQQLWPIHLDDGRQMLLPVEEVEVDYATDRAVF
jgi:hypothetical protein